MDANLRVTRGAQAFAFSIESPTRTIGFVKAQPRPLIDTMRYAQLFAASVRMYQQLKEMQNDYRKEVDDSKCILHPYMKSINNILTDIEQEKL